MAKQFVMRIPFNSVSKLKSMPAFCNWLFFTVTISAQKWHLKRMIKDTEIGHFTVVCSVTWPMNGFEAAGDLVLIQTSLLLSCKLCHCNPN